MSLKEIISYRNITKQDYQAVIELGTAVHGIGYIDDNNIDEWVKRGIKNNLSSGYVAYEGKKLVGFRLTYAAQQWQLDKWCSPKLWHVPIEKMCYFKCNTVDENYRGYGIGSKLLHLSIEKAKKQGALAGISHLWMQSPGNSAVKYFTKCGGVLIKEHPDKWNEWCDQGYICPVCHDDCHCSAAEMMIKFD